MWHGVPVPCNYCEHVGIAALGWKLDEEVLLARAARGDRAAAGAYLARQLPALQRSARRIAGRRVDPEDLLADAIEGLLVRWADGGEEIASPRSYLLASMRNGAINAARGPRARSASLDAVFDQEDRSALGADATVELEHELAWLRIAIARLSDAHRGALSDGTGADLPTENDRSADARHSLRARARRALRRAYLQVVLEEGASPACHEAISELPARVGDAPESTPGAPGHFRSCPRCRKRWVVFAGLAGGLSIAGAVVAPTGPSPARADGGAVARVDPDAGQDAGPGEGSRSASRTGKFASMPGRASRGAIASGAALIGIGILLAVAVMFPQLLRSGEAPDGEAPNGAPRAVIGPGAIFGLGSGGAVTAGMEFVATGDAVSEDGVQEVTVRLAFDVAGSDWSTRELSFDLPPGFDDVSGSEGWICDGARCTPEVADAREGVFGLRGTRGGENERIGVRWRAEASGKRVAADASSSVPLAGESFTTSAWGRAR